MKLEGALCAGSDAWFPTNQTDRELVVSLCRNECPAYRECLDFATSGVPLYGIVAGLNMAERGRLYRAEPEVPIEGVCIVCGNPFEFVQARVGRKKLICSYFCRRRRATQRNIEYRERRLFA